jgi:chaperonin GroES
LSENKDKDSVIGQVIAVGPGMFDRLGNLQPVLVQAGDHVLLPAYGGTTLEMNDDKFQIFRDTEILGKVEF